MLHWWTGSDGVNNYYWDDKHDPSEHVCACDAAGDCITERVTCNCDQAAPQWLSDQGLLTDANVLPVRELSFGGLEFDGQEAQFQLGPLTCSGKKVQNQKELCHEFLESSNNKCWIHGLMNFIRRLQRRRLVKRFSNQGTHLLVITSSTEWKD